jgi:hypothetical protein
VKTDGELHHRPGATLSAGSQTVLRHNCRIYCRR